MLIKLLITIYIVKNIMSDGTVTFSKVDVWNQ
jgi:hypothetical protein